MMPEFDPARDLAIARVIRAPRETVWRAWTDPRQLERWWVPAPARCRVEALELFPGGAFTSLYAEPGQELGPHLDACILAAEAPGRLVFTDALKAGFRPAASGFMTAHIFLREHAEGTEYVAQVLHAGPADRARHEELGFFDGWGTVAGQLAALVEGRA
ncbi:SRPBCC domain-containing protein [Propylenella binzhouense]|uniref:Polyketide cyclase n=1 Tax=Propylenella binzhouense TaxID=2555902 RepID=A0A964T8J9_9HYPH|nr:SRPBCC domain-containing protein [Propylenella binzhouense]MYZ50460.1 polyketide cyclase [Propylenella binzhouense]